MRGPDPRLLGHVAAVLVLVVSDGGSRLSGPAGPATARPLLSHDVALSDERTPADGGAGVRALEALARQMAGAPADEETALRLVRQAGRAGRLGWVEAFLRAAGRRTSTAALALARAELHYLRGDVAGGFAEARRARRMRPGSPEAALAHAAGRAARGDVLAALSVLMSPRAGGPDLAVVGLESRQRAAQLLALVEPGAAGASRAWSTWVEWRRRGDPAGQARALLLLGALDRVEGRPEAARRAMARALRMALAAGDPMTTAMALGQVADLDSRPGGRRSRQAAACQMLQEAGRQARLDCLLSALDSAWRDGTVAYALRVYDRIAPAVSGNPILELRLADPGIGLLRATGRLRDAELLAATAARAAARLLQPSLQAHYLTRVAILRRSQGRLEAAEAALDEAAGVAPAADVDLRVLRDMERSELARSRGQVGQARAWHRSATSSSRRASRDLRLLVDLQALRLELLSGPTLEPRPAPTREATAAATPGPETLMTRARSALQLEVQGDDLAAVRAYLETLRHLRDWTSSMRDPLLAALVGDAWRVLSRRAAELALEAGRVPAALEALELGRWAASTPLLANHVPGDEPGSRRVGPRRPVPSVPGRSALLLYLLGPERAWGVVIRDRGAFHYRIQPRVEALRARVEVWRQAVLSGQARLAEKAGEWLADALLGPADRLRLLDGVDRIHLVPDDVLHGLSFAALPDPGGTLYGERFVWSRSPSLEAWAAARKARPRAGPTVAFGPAGGADARAELAAAAGGPGGVSYAAGRATETRFRRAARVAGVLHFAGHATAPDPGLRGGALSFRADGVSDGRLTLPEILGLELEGAAVVLLGCDTVVRPGAPGGAGPAPELPGLGEAFLAAGARVVVGSLWPVREDAARELAQALYRAGGPAAGPRAVAEAQRRLRERWPRRPDRWAAAVWIGT